MKLLFTRGIRDINVNEYNVRLQKYLRNIAPKYLLFITPDPAHVRKYNAYWVSDISGVIPQHQEVNRQPLSHCHTVTLVHCHTVTLLMSLPGLFCYDLSFTENTVRSLEPDRTGKCSNYIM